MGGKKGALFELLRGRFVSLRQLRSTRIVPKVDYCMTIRLDIDQKKASGMVHQRILDYEDDISIIECESSVAVFNLTKRNNVE